MPIRRVGKENGLAIRIISFTFPSMNEAKLGLWDVVDVGFHTYI